MAREVLTGNEAIARGAWESGLVFGAAYPGTPSTEILENLARYREIQSEWAPNEKVAFEVAYGASVAGGRSLAAMKHVGVNVAADPLMTSAYTGANAGFVLISADDPGMHSSQNEQDNRRFAFFAKIPCLEPADSQEAKDFMGEALEISERFDTPVMLRVTTRVCHSKSIVSLGERKEHPYRPFSRDFVKYCMLPTSARIRRVEIDKRFSRLREFSNAYPHNRIELRSLDVGIITSGIAYQHVRDAFPDASTLKVALSNPLPDKLIREFASTVTKLFVVEELEPYMEDQIRAMGIQVVGKEVIPGTGELSVDVIRDAIEGRTVTFDAPLIPTRPPVLCPGCSHRGFFTVASRMKLLSLGDIGCYTLGAYPPLSAIDTCLCMGASVSEAAGFAKVLQGDKKNKVVGVIGDSTFVHSGITSLIHAIYNRANVVICILDNGTTAMTGHQEHPATGRTLKGESTHKLDLEKLCQALGVPHLAVVDPIDLEATRKALEEGLAYEGPSVIIFKAPCLIRDRKARKKAYRSVKEECKACGLCFKVGCPAISKDADDKAEINPVLCAGCSVCAQVCKLGAIQRPE
ncbi:MAG: indolepyruvate ferredoxin oxidoreductase subunit alpha [Candidatus Riflebacteria bacterium]|nr:indolepyruvate ferredoxin oxidoreductase subunit alpha [Candidatus Riflebacteria bacterium]